MLKSQIQRLTEDVARTYCSGEKQLFIIKSYRDGNEAELVHMFNLLQYEMFTSLGIVMTDKAREDFPTESLVWVSVQNGVTKIQEATCEDELAELQYMEAKRLLKSDKETAVTTDGQFRSVCLKLSKKNIA